MNHVETALPAAPVAESDRLQSLDVLRGVALFGILLMNITSFGMPFAYNDPSVYGGATGANLWAWITTSMLFEGTQRGMFSLLFGANSFDQLNRVVHCVVEFFRRHFFDVFRRQFQRFKFENGSRPFEPVVY